MKALSKLKAEPGICMTDVDKVDYGPDDLLIKIHKTAICGSDIHIYEWNDWAQKTVDIPTVIGHEYSGEVISIGKNVEHFAVGDRVSGEGHISCGHCRNCREGYQHICPVTSVVGVHRSGAFAEFLAIPAENAFKLPDDIDDELAAIFDPFGNAVHTALSFDVAGEDVLITGAGPIGMMAALVVRHCGARNVVITDVNEYRLDLVQKMGSVRTVNVACESLSDVMTELKMQEGFSVGLEMSGAPVAFQEMLNSMKNGGRIALLGLMPDNTGIDWSKVLFKGLYIKGIFGREMYRTWYKMSGLIQSGLDITPVITHRLHVDDYQQGFELMASGQTGKVILNWDD